MWPMTVVVVVVLVPAWHFELGSWCQTGREDELGKRLVAAVEDEFEPGFDALTEVELDELVVVALDVSFVAAAVAAFAVVLTRLEVAPLSVGRTCLARAVHNVVPGMSLLPSAVACTYAGTVAPVSSTCHTAVDIVTVSRSTECTLSAPCPFQTILRRLLRPFVGKSLHF